MRAAHFALRAGPTRGGLFGRCQLRSERLDDGARELNSRNIDTSNQLTNHGRLRDGLHDCLTKRNRGVHGGMMRRDVVRSRSHIRLSDDSSGIFRTVPVADSAAPVSCSSRRTIARTAHTTTATASCNSHRNKRPAANTRPTAQSSCSMASDKDRYSRDGRWATRPAAHGQASLLRPSELRASSALWHPPWRRKTTT